MKLFGRIAHHKLLNLLDLRLHGILVPLLLQFTAPREYRLEDTLVIAGAPRAGTTWLAELVNMVPGSAILFEPLHLGQVPQARRAGFKWETMVARGTSWPEGERFLRQVLLGKLRNSWTMSHVTLDQARHTQRWIVKFVRANMMLDWLAHTFPIRPPALIIRHPCACIASYLQKGWPQPLKAPADHQFFTVYPQLRGVCNGLDSVEEYLAVSWCMEYYVALTAQPPLPYHIVCYERLVRDGLAELTKLFKAWDMPLPAEAMMKLDKPSMTTASFSQVGKGRDPLTGWQRYFSTDQSAKILHVVRAFGLDFYNAGPEPDYERLYSQTPVRQNRDSGVSLGDKACEEAA